MSNQAISHAGRECDGSPIQVGYIQGSSAVRFHLAPDSLEEAVLDAVRNDHGMILALSSSMLYGVEGIVLGKIGSSWNVSFTADEAVEMLVNINDGHE